MIGFCELFKITKETDRSEDCISSFLKDRKRKHVCETSLLNQNKPSRKRKKDGKRAEHRCVKVSREIVKLETLKERKEMAM